MSFLASIGNMMGGKPSSQQQSPQGGPSNNQNGNQNPGDPSGGQGAGSNGFSGQNGDGNQSDPRASNGNPNQQVNGSNKPVDPSELWNKMWDTGKDGEKANTPPQLNLDPAVLDQVSGKMDFMQGADPELIQKATSGDTQALFSLMNHVGRAAYRNSLSHSGALTNEFIGQRETFSGTQLSGKIKDQMTQNLMSEGEGGNAPPYIRQQMQDLSKRIQRANPDASPSQVRQHVQEYIKQLTQYAGGGQSGQSENQNGSNSAPAAINWDDWHSDEQQQ